MTFPKLSGLFLVLCPTYPENFMKIRSHIFPVMLPTDKQTDKLSVVENDGGGGVGDIMKIMFGSWGRWWCRKPARVCKYRQDAIQAGVYIIFNSKFICSWYIADPHSEELRMHGHDLADWSWARRLNLQTHNSILIHHRIKLTDNCPCRLTSEDDDVRRCPDKTWCNTEVVKMCSAPGVHANWERVAAGFKLEALIGQ